MDRDKPDMLTRKQVAERYCVHVRTIGSWVKESDFPSPVRIGKSLRWRRRDLEQYDRRKRNAD